MTVNGVNGANTQAGQMGMNQAMDSYSKNIQNQIANAQKQLQELSSNEDVTLEEKMKKRQEIQQEITNLTQQLRQRRMEQRKEKQQKSTSMDDMLGGNSQVQKESGKAGTGMSQAGMTAILSADTSMKQAKVQGSAATQMEGRANVLKAEIKQDGARGGDTTKKQEELAKLEQKAVNATASQMNSLADANKAVKEAAVAERTENKASETKEEKKAQAENEVTKTAENGAEEEKAQDSVSSTDAQTENAAAYAHVDVRL